MCAAMGSPKVEKGRVLAAMSGGVDSAVATARLVDAGYEVVGVTFHLWDYPDDQPEKSRCCAPEDAHDARLVADHLGIAHYTFDRREMFEERVVAPFVDAYLEGYRSERAFSDKDAQYLPAFLIICGLNYLGWMQKRGENLKYADRLAQEIIGGLLEYLPKLFAELTPLQRLAVDLGFVPDREIPIEYVAE